MLRRLAKIGVALELGKSPWFVLLVALPLLSPTVVSGAESPKRVLIFSSEEAYLPAITIVNQAIRSTLKNGSPVPVQFFGEAQDSFRISNDKYEEELVRLLQRKYDGMHIDLIYVLSSPALRFLLKHQGQLFSDTPVIFIVVDQNQVTDLNLGSHVTGVSGKVELSPTLDIALALQPQTQKVMVVAGNASLDNALVEQAHREFRPYEGKTEFTYLTGLPIEELRKELADLTDKSIVFYLSVNSDRGSPVRIYTNPEVLSLLAQSSSAPIYGTSQTYLGSGIIGGRLIDFEAMGTHAAETGLRILAGESPQNIPPQTVPSTTMFDWRELRRWGVDESKLPAGSIVRFKEPTAWEQYKWRIVGAVSLIILQTLLIVWLLINRARRRRAEEASKASEKRYRNVVETQTELICRYLPDSTLTFVNDAYCRYFGKTCVELIGTKFLEFIPEPARDAALRHVASLIENPRAETYEHEVVLPNGKRGWQQWIDHVVGTNGHGAELQGIGRDITERRLAEELLRESEERLKQAISVARFGVFEHDHLTGILHSSPLTREIHAWGEEGMSSLEGIVAQLHPEDRETFIAAVRRAHDPAGDGFFSREYRIVPDGGKVRWVSARAQTFFEGEGGARRPLRTIGAEVDVTERKEAEEALRVSETRFRIMADSAPLLIWICGPDKLCTYVNQGWLEFTGRTIEQELGNGWTEGIFSEDYASSLEFFDSVFDRREPFKMEYRLRRADGVFCWVYTSGTPRFSSDGEFLGYIGSCIDIADRKEAEEALQVAHEEVNKLKNQLKEENIYLQEEIKLAHNVDEIIGESNAIKYVLFKIEQVAQTDTTVLILGETGTGKELVARAIHSQSLRKDRPLIKVNCAALSASLIESELFGHEKGAFTGASARKMGRFELADGATIFLDEIGELPLELQPKLLRVIQDGEFERLGSSSTIKADVRIIAATNRNMKVEVEKGKFREDLWYRLNVFPITVPPLRQRKEDIPLLVEHFVSILSKKVGKAITSLSAATLKKLQDHSWPGNIRELANVIERGVINAQGPVLHIADQFAPAKPVDSAQVSQTLEQVEKEYITHVLDQAAWRIEGPSGAARILGLNPSTLRTRMLKLGIQKSIRSFSESSGITS